MEGLVLKSRSVEKRFKTKLLFLLLLILLFSLVVVLRLVHINLSSEEVIRKVIEKYGDVRIIKVPTYRGSILTEDGKTLAFSYPVGYVYAYKMHLFKDEDKKKKFIEGLSHLSGVPGKVIRRRLERATDFREVLTIPAEKVREVRKLIAEIDYDEKLKRTTEPYLSSHVGVGEKYLRYYPHRRFASNLIGFVRKDGVGGGGLESQYNTYLSSSGGFAKYIVYRDKGFLFVEPGSEQQFEARDLRLSLNFRLQATVEEIKREIVRRWRPQRVVIIVMESDTGKIRAYTTYPDFDPNRYTRFYPDGTRNLGVTDLFEPGSTFKPFLIAYALEKGLISPTTPIRIDYGRMKVHRKILRDPVEYLRKRKYITPEELLVYSSNVGAVKVGMRLTPEDFRNLLRLFYLNSPPRVLEGETAPYIPDFRNEVNRAYASIGQGVGFHALHLLASFNALVTGKWVRPSVLAGEETQEKDLPLSPRTVRWLRKTLIKVVEEGTGRRARTELFYVGGKTGTAQKYDKRLRRYSRSKLTTYFIGFFPEKPKFTAIIIVDEPKGKNVYGGTVAAPYFKKLVERTAVIYGLSPDKK
ncbi:MAG: penicillin-binding protein 2 [Aquificae bacterium]|nr:penicillin-binding protein 2 [Aquificota bacterium]